MTYLRARLNLISKAFVWERWKKLNRNYCSLWSERSYMQCAIICSYDDSLISNTSSHFTDICRGYFNLCKSLQTLLFSLISLQRRRQSTSLPRGIVLPRGKKSKDSLFSLLTEGEAVDLASDFGQIIKEERFFQTLCQSVEESEKQSVRYVYCSMQNTKWCQ